MEDKDKIPDTSSLIVNRQKRSIFHTIHIYTFILTLIGGFTVILVSIIKFFFGLDLPYYSGQILGLFLIGTYIASFLRGLSNTQKEIESNAIDKFSA